MKANLKLVLILAVGFSASLASARAASIQTPAELSKRLVEAAAARLNADFGVVNDESAFGIQCEVLDRQGDFSCSSQLLPQGTAVCDDESRDRGSEEVRGKISADGEITITGAGVRESCSTFVLDKNDQVIFDTGN